MVIISDQIEQQTDEWQRRRAGRITASRVKAVLTAPRSKADEEAGKLSKSAEDYLWRLLYQRITGISGDSIPPTKAMRWGIEWEDTARRVYEEITGNDVKQVGFIERDELSVGCSPDGLVGDVGGLEIKCPFGDYEHMKTLHEQKVPTQYVAQVQFSLWVSNRDWWDFVSYDPRIEQVEFAFVRFRVTRDEELIQTIERKCKRLLDELEQRHEALERLGLTKFDSESHQVAHLCTEPIELIHKGEVITI